MSKAKNEASNQKNDQPVVKPTTDETPLKKLCAEFGISPKAARRKLRKAWRSENTTVNHTLRARWVGEDQLRAVLAPTKQ